MHITELRIRHFRSFGKAKFSFRVGVNTLIERMAPAKPMRCMLCAFSLTSLSREMPCTFVSQNSVVTLGSGVDIGS